MGLPGEALLSATHVLPVIEPGPARVTRAQIRAADRVADEARTRLRAFYRADRDAKAPAAPEVDYDHLLGLLSARVTPQVAGSKVAGWPDQGLADEYAEALGAAWGYLQQVFPKKTRDYLTGPENVRPSDLELARFRRALALVDDPLGVIERMAAGMLLPSEVDVLEKIYPALLAVLSQVATEELVAETARRRAGGKNWRLPRRKEVMLRRLLRQPRGAVAGRTADALQADYEQRRGEQEQQQQRPVPDAKLPEADNELTRQQRVEFKK